ncbi:MAG: glucose-6-phosphate isomerase [Candidatus Omnitrophica bacterium]|nr:glucose-6-phosphate isomerase [Candidatus Omnitrophota bacterium]
MIDLNNFLGMNIKFNPQEYKLIFDKDPAIREPAARTIDQMKEVLANSNISSPKELYFMYRDVYCLKDNDIIKEHRLRFDVTVIKPGMLGKEFMKTAGHYHPKSYPELYEIVYGEALCLQQRVDKEDVTKIKEVIVVRAKQGQKIICLPNFGHILINISDKPLITSNWVSSEFSSEYDLYKKARGAAYYAFADQGSIIWEKNKFFNEIPPINFLTPNDDIAEFDLKTRIPMYSLISDLRKLDFLNQPDKYKYDNAFKK